MTKLISAAELQDEADFAADFYGPGWQDNPATRRIVNALVDAEAAVRAFEDAARTRANTTDRAKAFHKMAAGVFCPPAADDEPERLRKAGAL